MEEEESIILELLANLKTLRESFFKAHSKIIVDIPKILTNQEKILKNQYNIMEMLNNAREIIVRK